MAAILLIDDNRMVRETLLNVFSEQYECHTADRAEQALQLLEFQNYDLVITDVSMPGVGGLEILRRIKQRHTIPVIVISGRGDEYEEAAVKMGAFAFFAKPFRLDALEVAVAEALATRTHQQPAAKEEWVPLSTVEGQYVARVLQHTSGNKQAAARILGIDRKTLDRMIKRHEIQRRP